MRHHSGRANISSYILKMKFHLNTNHNHACLLSTLRDIGIFKYDLLRIAAPRPYINRSCLFVLKQLGLRAFKISKKDDMPRGSFKDFFWPNTIPIICVFHSFGKKWEESRIKKLHLFRELFWSNQTTRNFKIHFHSLKLDGSRVIPTTGLVPPSKTIHHQKSAPGFGWNLRETVAFFVSGIPGSIHVWCMHTYMKTLPETYSLPHFSLKMDGCKMSWTLLGLSLFPGANC